MPPQPNIPNNSEIEQALKEFESKSNEQPISNREKPILGVITPQSPNTSSHTVEGVSFDTDNEVESYSAIKFYKETVEPKMVKAVIKLSGGTVKNQKQAEWILLGFVILIVSVSVWLLLKNTLPNIPPPIDKTDSLYTKSTINNK